MIKRWILHVEMHLGYWPRISLRRAPRSGDIVWEHMRPHRLERCRGCDGDGFLARELHPLPPEFAELSAPIPDPTTVLGPDTEEEVRGG